MASAGATSSARPLDAVALARVLRRLQQAREAPWLHAEVARRMAERLPIIKLRPERIIDWWSFLGAGRAALAQTYPKAQITAVEPDGQRRDATAAACHAPWWSPKRWRGGGPRTLLETEVEPGSAQLVWANMVLHGVADPQALMVQWHRALAVDGFLMFSTLGPGSLQRLRELYAAQGWPPPFAPFVDMHDLGDMLLQAGFADPVMDQETITLTWPNAQALLAELRALGGNVDPARHRGLRGRRWHERLIERLQARCGASGRIGLEFELVYGHAFRPLPRVRVSAETAVPLAELRAMARSPRRQR